MTLSSEPTQQPSKKAKLSYKLQQELDALPKQIDELEQALEALQKLTSTTEFHKGEREAIQQKMDEMVEVDTQLQGKYQRWDELESMV